MIKFIAAALISTALSVPAFAADRDDCKMTMTDYTEKVSKLVVDYKNAELPKEMVALVLSKLGEPPVEPPYTFALTGGTVKDEPVVQLVIHDGECILTATPVMPAQKFFNLLGLVDAGTNG